MVFSLQGLTDALDGVTGGLTNAVSPKTDNGDATNNKSVIKDIASCLPLVNDTRESAAANSDRGDDARDEPEEEKLLAYSDEPTELYNLVKDGDWSGVIKCAQRNPLEAKTWIVEKNTDGTTRWELLPLHLACENQPPVEGELELELHDMIWNKSSRGKEPPMCYEYEKQDIYACLGCDA